MFMPHVKGEFWHEKFRIGRVLFPLEFYNQILIIKRGRSFIWKFELEFFILRGFEDRSDLGVLKPRDDAIGSSEVMYSKWVWNY